MQLVFPLLVSALIVCIAVPILEKIALRIGFVDKPNNRKIHVKPIPLMGGIALYLACVLSILLFHVDYPTSGAIITGGTILMLTGLLDDWYKTKGKDFPIWPRLLIYGLVSAIPLWFGIKIAGITDFHLEGMIIFPEWLAILATMIWIFAFINMINFIDGVDGLSSGIVMISSLTLFLIAIIQNYPELAILSGILAGACGGFLGFNFYPARIFMGDSGAIFIGYMIAVLAIDGVYKSAAVITIVVPMLVLGVPIMDTFIVFFRRLLKGQGLHKADKLHTHHSLMKWGLSQKQTVLFLYLIGIIFSLLSIILVLVLKYK
ncbi:undecaprenyl/decaprenyl-phosphate alpha-N-acetylglucosaminyl 1-phosphate transferase [Paenibacillus albiflavus]|uniref:Undecaprenyl/decaprenyl-phosphate alpha-N-acetylglucosaminyl 1-phosphate transferase n=1 Tax=Paenibacillus albiflavus TaxID=2545760 RepID=A0A4R4E0I8_9BACL|nr:MraY family glycosyltransferase [Paenibacillus albiflavus]TCZ72866.1 undecaprenyl/decaprenyl-phosphate alpha-N-acetylglucosaminyl 1-phosphate transferase [Paenibacillus albiflavus]